MATWPSAVVLGTASKATFITENLAWSPPPSVGNDFSHQKPKYWTSQREDQKAKNNYELIFHFQVKKMLSKFDLVVKNASDLDQIIAKTRFESLACLF